MEWEPDTASPMCRLCSRKWTMFKYRRHHCRNCGKLVCYKCSSHRIYLTIKSKEAERVCDKCAERIHSTEGTPLPPGALDEEEDPDESDAEIRSVVSDGKCKANETPFRNSMKVPPAGVNAMVQDMEEVEESDEEDEDEGFGSPEGPGTHTLDLEEMHLHRSPSGTPISVGPASSRTEATGASDRTDDSSVFALSGLNSGVHRENSLNPDHTLKSSVSKFGVMTFSDEERSERSDRSARNSGESEVGEEVQSYSASELPLESGKDADGYSLKKSGGAEAPVEVQNVMAEETAESAQAAVIESAEQNATAVKETVDQHSTAGGLASALVPASDVVESEPDEPTPTADTESAKDTAEGSTETTAAAQTAEPVTPEPVAAVKSTTPKTRKIVLGKKSSPVRTEMDTEPSTTGSAAKLHAGLSPMPAGGTVRRLSTLTPRTPFNSAVTMSPAAAEIAAAQAKVLAEAAAAQAREAPESAPSVTVVQAPSEDNNAPAAEAAVLTAEDSSAAPVAEESTGEPPASATESAAVPEQASETTPVAASECAVTEEECAPTQEDRTSNADLESVVSTESGERKSESKRGGRGGRGNNSSKGGKKVWK